MTAHLRDGVDTYRCECIRGSEEGCVFEYIKFAYGRKKYKRNRCGCHDGFEDMIDGSCPDCEARYGKLHHVGCDCEICPRCSHQVLSCYCPDPRDCVL